ncbi:midnolin homolog [Cylas formicarius]|uniref:midnolin homolog n=1 Tax=Cylas formicarius TaxID=197179 RepID=UPI0029586314|nr:midnolin homolog [Cylas formicarius]
MEHSTEPEHNFCADSQGQILNSTVNLHIIATTGNNFHLAVPSNSTVEHLKKLISKRLKVSGSKICLLFKDRQLEHGSLSEHGISDGSKIMLLPNVETGLVNHHPEISIMQILESLNDTQVNDFLCGKAPLNLTMRLGDHMMFIQLQLSSVPSNNRSSHHVPLTQCPDPPNVHQACKNLQRAVQQLSSDITAKKSRGVQQESVFSGTFSRVLNPVLQDSKGRPHRDVGTIIHILNDLLCSVPDQNGSGGGGPSAATSSDAADAEGVASPVSDVVFDENSVTRSKLDQLRLVLGEKRERRKRRKQKPYSLPPQNEDAVSV